MVEDNINIKISEVKRNLKNLNEEIVKIDKEITKLKRERIKKRKEETELKRVLTQLCGFKKKEKRRNG